MTVVNADRMAPPPPALLDRLVDGELDEAGRLAVLTALDREADGWKRCALAFLEAQAWREAVRVEQVVGMATDSTTAAGAPRRPFFRQFMSVAAAVAVAFCVGFVARGLGHAADGPTPRGIARQGPSAAIPSARPPRNTATASNTLASVPEYVRSQMERQGYRVQGDLRMVPVALADGRKVAVPVETVSMKYVGQRIH